MQDYHELPKLRDSLSYLYVEHAVLNQKDHAIEYIREDEGRVMIPVASLSVLLLGPGTKITHAAIRTLSDNGCAVVWVGEDGTKFYAQGTGETRRSYHLLRQAEFSCDPQKRLGVVRRMYQKRFPEPLAEDLTLEQIRGMEGARVRSSYYQASHEYNVEWHGRSYDRGNWGNSDPVNRALSAANALLNGLCHTAIVSGGYSSALGFIHTGKQLSFVYDIADLYKAEVTIPLAFQIVAEATEKVEARVRAACREKFRTAKLMERVLPDIDSLLEIDPQSAAEAGDYDEDPALPAPLWEDPDEEEAS
ncbi:MAG: type I-E CRISPR-associated endonuclease Cas1e [Anaerolineae bacterium]|nr:type I-E CRISPR-associated endonuclease Cas1e [Anaerolineae bacterium]